MVKNDFPNVDKVLRKLRDYTTFFKDKLEKTTDEDEKFDYEFCLQQVEEFIEAISNYLDSVCNAEMRIQQVRMRCQDEADWKDKIVEEDRNRTRYHSDIITLMIRIDKMADRYKLERVFDYAGKFFNNDKQLKPSTIEEKGRMLPEARDKRREMGNFGLYIAASVTAGISKEYEITDEEARNFANCEGSNQMTDTSAFNKIRAASSGVKRNMDAMLDL